MTNLRLQMTSLAQNVLPHGVMNARRACKEFSRLGMPRTKAIAYSMNPRKIQALRFTRMDYLPGGSIDKLKYVVDVGAHVGKWTSSLLELCLPEHILVVEPSPEIHEQLENRFSRVDNVTLHKVAVSDFSGNTDFHLTSNQEFNSISKVQDSFQSTFEGLAQVERKVTVPVQTLDGLCRDFSEISLLKIDVQGFEKEVIRGAKEILKKSKVLIVEMNFSPLYDGESSFTEVHEMLTQSGFYIRNVSPSYCHDGRSMSCDAIYEKIAS